METVEDIVIVGAGIAGLATALGLHRFHNPIATYYFAFSFIKFIKVSLLKLVFELNKMGLRGLVLVSSDGLRTSGFALTMWPNAWKALDALGVGDSLRQQHLRIQGTLLFSSVTGLPTSQVSYDDKGKQGDREIRCVKRKALLEALEKELPRGTIRFSSKIVSLEEAEYFKVVHLADGTFIKTKVLIGCDGVNSVVASWLGLAKPVLSGRLGIRGIAEYHNPNNGHDFSPSFLQFFGRGFRSGFLPCDCNSIYWFFTFTSSLKYKDIEDDPVKMKQFVLNNIGKVPARVVDAVEKTDLQNIISSPLRLRWPWNVLWRESYKGNVCVAGDALHPMTPDIGQGGCSALEDAVILARCLAEAMSTQDTTEQKEDEEYNRIKKALEKFGKQRKWRSSMLISTAYVVGVIQQSSGKIMNFLRDKVLSTYLAGLLLKTADFDCGKLNMPSKIKIQ